jgi:hypothetical protein
MIGYTESVPIAEFELLQRSFDQLWQDREPLMQREARLCLFAAEIIEATDHPDEQTPERILASVERLKSWLARERQMAS